MTDRLYRLSLLDKSPVPEGSTAAEALATSLRYVERAEALGFHRVWYAEHHGASTLASTAPEILVAFALARTKRIRIGSGGVLLQHYSPFKVAEQFRLLSVLVPGRVDLGIGKAPGGLPFGTKALQSERGIKPRPFEQKLAELDAFLKDGLPADHPLHGAVALPEAPLPARILLGASPESAQLAASLGWEFTYAGHHDGSPAAIRAAVEAYRTTTGRAPALAVAAHVAPTREEAQRLAAQHTIVKVHLPDGHSVNLPNEDAAREYARQAGFVDFRLEEKRPSVLAGTAGDVHAAFADLNREFGITEFVIDNPVASPAERLAAIELLAEPGAALAAE